jgi:lupus La protein
VDPRIKKQVEFYFSDSNLPKDKFLRSKVEETKEGWVDIELLTTFKRMKDFAATVESVVAVAKESDFLEASEDGKRIRRTTQLPESDVTLVRSVVARGMHVEVSRDPASVAGLIDKLSAFFGQHGKVLSVRIDSRGPTRGKEKPQANAEKEDKEGHSKEHSDGKAQDEAVKDGEAKSTEEAEKKVEDGKAGESNQAAKNENDEGKLVVDSAFVEFSSADEAKQVCAKDIDFEGKKLVLKMKSELSKEKPDHKRGRPDDKKDRNADRSKRQRTEGGSEENKKDKGRSEHQNEAKEYVAYPKGIFVKVAGLGESASFKQIKEHFSKYGSVKFVEFQSGETEACVRFEKPEDASEAVKQEQETKPEIGGIVPEVSLITGEDEDKKLEDIKQKQMSRISQQSNDRGRGRGGGRGGRGGRGGIYALCTVLASFLF